MLFSQLIKKIIFIGLVLSTLTAPLHIHAGFWGDLATSYANCFKQNKILTFVGTLVVSGLTGWGCWKFYNVVKNWGNENKKNELNKNKNVRPDNIKKQNKAPELPNVSLTILQAVDRLEEELNALLERRISPELQNSARMGIYNKHTIQGWIDNLFFIESQLFNLKIRCNGDLHKKLQERYKGIENTYNSQHVQKIDLKYLYNSLDKHLIAHKKGAKASWEEVNNAIKTIKMETGAINNQEIKRAWDLYTTILDRIFNNIYAKENYDAFLSGSSATLKLQINDSKISRRLEELFNKCHEQRVLLSQLLNDIQSAQLLRADMPTQPEPRENTPTQFQQAVSTNVASSQTVHDQRSSYPATFGFGSLIAARRAISLGKAINTNAASTRFTQVVTTPSLRSAFGSTLLQPGQTPADNHVASVEEVQKYFEGQLS